MANFIDWLKKPFNPKKNMNMFKMMTVTNDSYFAYNGKIYHSDIVRACLRPYAKAIGKTVAKHVRETINEQGGKDISVNPDAYMKFLLEEPNPYMNYQKMIEKMAMSLKLNGNAFALIIRDENGVPMQLYPLPATGAQTEWISENELGVHFYFSNGQNPIFKYSDLIHLRGDYYEHDILGDSIADALVPLMECVGTMDKGIIQAIKNSGIVRWLLKISGGSRPEDIKKYAEDFASNYLSMEQGNAIGVAATDAKADAKQIEPKDYVPNAALMDRQKERVLELFNTNDDILQSKESADTWNSYFEHEVEPDIVQLSTEMSRKLFNRRQRAFGNRIVVEAYNLAHASYEQKLKLSDMVDRGALTPNEWRAVFNLSPVPGGDQIIRRLDTAVVNQIKNLANRIQGKDPETDQQLIQTINRLIEGREENA